MAYSDSLRSSTGVDFEDVADLIDGLHESFEYGWITLAQTWTYASASSFTVSGDQTAIFTKGTPLKFVNSTTKYANVASSSYSAPDTTVTIIVNIDYTIANTTISSPQISRGDPSDFPPYFSYTPTLTGFSSNPTSSAYTYSVTGRWVTVTWRQGGIGTSNATGFTISTPIAALSLSSMAWTATISSSYDNGAALATPSTGLIVNGSSTIILYKNGVDTAASWTATNGKICSGQVRYPI